MILRYISLSLFTILVFLVQPVSYAAEFQYTADALPSASGWQVYGSSSSENGNGITSSVVNDGGNVCWKLVDSSGTYRCRERNVSLGDISFNTGATLAARVRCQASSSSSYNLGISNGNVGGMYLAIRTDRIQLVRLNGTVVSTAYGDGTGYHSYYLTVLNSTLGDNSTATWRVYRDGAQVLTWTGAGEHDGYDGYVAGHAGTSGTGTWYFDWIIARNDGAFSPSQWDPFALPTAPTIISPALGAEIITPNVIIQWAGGAHTTYEVHVNTSNNPTDAGVWDSGEVASSGYTCTTGPLPNGTYYVFVRLGNSTGWGPWSAAGRMFSINVTSVAPGTPSIIFPNNGGTARSSRPVLQWIGDRHSNYEVHINTTNNPDDAGVWDSGVVTSTDDSCDLGPLPNGSYYAFVRLGNSFGWGPWSPAGHSFTVNNSPRKLKKGWVILRDDLEDDLELLSHMREYHINHIELSHDLMMYVWEPINDVTKRNKLNQLIQAAHANGTPDNPVEVVLWVHESDFTGVPSQYFIGGKLNYDDPGYWNWLANRYRTLFSSSVCPGADGLVLTFSENFFGADPWDRTKTIHTGMTPAQTMAKIIETLWEVCLEYNPIKSLYVRNWAGAGPDRWVRDAVLSNDPRIWMMSKATGAGDWWMIRDDYDIIGTCTGHPEMIEFDVVGEYWGLTNTPWAGISFLKHLWSDFALPRGADGMVARVDRDGGKAIESPARINMYALDMLAEYPDLKEDNIYSYWTSHWFGQAAAAKVASSLKRTFDITNACYGMPTTMYGSGSREAFSTSVARNYCLQSIFDIDCVSGTLKSFSNFMDDGSQTNYQVLRDPLMRAASMLGLTVPSTLFGDFSPAYSDLTSPTCTVTLVDAQSGLDPNSFRVEFSRDGGSSWINHSNFTVTASGLPTDPYHIVAHSIPFNSLTAALNKVRFTATNLSGTTTTSGVYTVRGKDWAEISLGTMASDGIIHPQGSDGDTVSATAGGRSCRRLASSSEASFYFSVDDGFAYDRSPQTLYLEVDYYGSSGSITPIYDSTETYEQPLAPVYLNGSANWRTVVWRLDNVNFGNRNSSSGADFRLYVGGNTGIYISRVRVHYTPPAGMLAQPDNLQVIARSTTEMELSWDAVPGATGYRVYRDETCIGSPGATTFIDTGLQPNTQYIYRVVACGASNYTSCASDYRYKTTLSVPPSPSTVTCNRQPAAWQTNSNFVFSAPSGFGWGKVAYYRYVWDESPTHVWTGKEASWPSVDPPSTGGWSVWRPTISPTSIDSGWLLYDGSTTMRGIFEAMVSENGTPAWMFADQSNFFLTKVKMNTWPNVPIHRDVGATLMVRMKAADSPRGWTNNSWNFGFNLTDCQEIGAMVQPGAVKIIGPSASSSGTAIDNGYAYHTYTLTLKNATPGINSSTRFALYRDGQLVQELTHGTGPSGQWSGPLLGQPTSSSMGAWYYQWAAWRNDGAHVPTAPNAPLSLVAPPGGSSSLYLHLQGYNADGVPNGTLDLGPYYYWNGSTPVPPKVTDDGRFTTRDALHFTWSPAAPVIDSYEFAVGSSPGSQDILPFTTVGTAREFTRKGLSMVEGQTYYITVRGISSGNVGPGGKSDGITVAPDRGHSGDAKLLADGSPAALYDQVVTAVFGDCAYVQDHYPGGLQVITNRPVDVGDRIDLAGVMSGAGGERRLLADTVVASEPE